MKYLLTIAFVLLLQLTGKAQTIPANIKLQNGDFLFEDLDCGPLCDAIEQVTQSYGGNHFSHIGLVYVKGDSSFIIEAIGNNVRMTPLAQFTSRTKHKIFIGRMKPEYHHLVDSAISFSLKSIGIPYDDDFLYNNGKYYCSELIYDAFQYANKGKPVFQLEPMTFKPIGSKEFFPVWVDYYKKLSEAIPEGKPGINPGGISRSKYIEILNP